MGKLLILFTVVPLVELYLLVLLGGVLGFGPTVALVLVTGLLGAWLAKLEGLRVLRQWQDALGAGQMPAEGVLGGVLLLVGGVLLVTPGVLTDVVGLSLLFPPSRRLVANQLRPWLRRKIEQKIEQGRVTVVTGGLGDTDLGSWHPSHDSESPFDRLRGSGPSPDVIDVEAEVIHEGNKED